MQAKHNRLEFLKGAARIGTRSFLPAALLVGPALAAVDVDPEAIRKLALRLRGRLITASSDAYDEARRVNIWNHRTIRRPALVMRCQSDDDAVRTIEFARRHRLAVAVRGGGHSFLGWGNCDGGVLVDLSGISGIRSIPSREAAKPAGAL